MVEIVNIVHISQTPIAGAAWAWSEAFKEACLHSWCVARREVRDLSFPADESYPPKTDPHSRFDAADVIFCHQGHPYRQPWYPKGKPTVFCYHSQPHHVYRRGEKDGWPWCVIGQYHPRYYPGCAVVPNLMPLKHPWYQPGEKPTDHIRIAYSPSWSKESMPLNPGGWDDKGYQRTIDILQHLESQEGPYPVRADIITGVPLEECLKRKAAAHIIIDECVTGSYHRSSLEGLALGAVVINNCDAACANNLRALTDQDIPFVRCGLEDLEATLKQLVQAGPEQLAAMGKANRTWIETGMDPVRMVERWFRPLINEAIAIAKEK